MKVYQQWIGVSLLTLSLGCSDSSDSKTETPQAEPTPSDNIEEQDEGTGEGDIGPVNFAFEDGEPLPVFIRGSLNEWGDDWEEDLSLAQASGSELVWADDCYQGQFELPAGMTTFKFASYDALWNNLNIGGYNLQDGTEDTARNQVQLNEAFPLNVDFRPTRGEATGNPAALQFNSDGGLHQFTICFAERDLLQAHLTVTSANASSEEESAD
ncbi:MAG: hypothetical protein ACOH5I_08615 [Oligoflexus sp.]